MFDLFPQQNFADMLKSTAFRGARRGGKNSIPDAIKRLEKAPIWDAPTFAQAIDQVCPGAIHVDQNDIVHVDGGAPTLVAIVDTYLELTHQTEREVM